MATSRARLQAHVDDLIDGDFPVNLSWVSANASGIRLSNQTLLVGDNTFVPNALTTLWIIVPPTNNTTFLLLKGDTSDAGIELQTAKPTAIAWRTGHIIINVLTQVTGVDIIEI